MPVSMTDVPELQPGVLEAIREQARSSPEATTGGVLIGWVQGEAITVERAAKCAVVNTRNGELEFTPACWDVAYAAATETGAESRIVGWYHINPRHGATLSAYDRSLHRSLFSDPSQVALVMDAGTGEIAWFGWQVELITELQDAPKKGPAGEAEAAPQPAPARRLVAAISLLAVLVLAAAGTYAWGHSTATTRVVAAGSNLRPQLQAARSQIQQLQAQTSSLRDQLRAEAASTADIQQQLQTTKDKLREATQRLQASNTTTGTVTFMYQVRPGDSMFELAQIFYGSGKKWAKIWHANPSPDPNILIIGSWLKVPLTTA